MTKSWAIPSSHEAQLLLSLSVYRTSRHGKIPCQGQREFCRNSDEVLQWRKDACVHLHLQFHASAPVISSVRDVEGAGITPVGFPMTCYSPPELGWTSQRCCEWRYRGDEYWVDIGVVFGVL